MVPASTDAHKTKMGPARPGGEERRGLKGRERREGKREEGREERRWEVREKREEKREDGREERRGKGGEKREGKTEEGTEERSMHTNLKDELRIRTIFITALQSISIQCLLHVVQDGHLKYLVCPSKNSSVAGRYHMYAKHHMQLV